MRHLPDSKLGDPVTCGEDIARNVTQTISLAPQYCDQCADYHIVNTLKRLSGLMSWDSGGRKPILDALHNVIAEVSDGHSGQIDFLIAACADTAILSTTAHAAFLAGDAVLGRARFTAVDQCRTPLMLCEDFGIRNGLTVQTDVVDLLDTSKTFSADIIIMHNFLPFIAVDLHADLLRTLGRWLKSDGRLILWNPVKGPAIKVDSHSRLQKQIATIKEKIESGLVTINEPKDTLYARLDRMIEDPRPGEKRFTDVNALPDLIKSAGLEVRSVEEVHMGSARNSLYLTVIAGRPAG